MTVPLLQVADHHCREIVGRDDDGLALSCGAPRVAGAYCVMHARRNYVVGAARFGFAPTIEPAVAAASLPARGRETDLAAQRRRLPMMSVSSDRPDDAYGRRPARPKADSERISAPAMPPARALDDDPGIGSTWPDDTALVAACAAACRIDVARLLTAAGCPAAFRARTAAAALLVRRNGRSVNAAAARLGVVPGAIRAAVGCVDPLLQRLMIPLVADVDTVAAIVTGELALRDDMRVIATVRAQSVIVAVARAARLPVEEMLSQRRMRRLVVPRQIAMALCCALTRLSLPAIGRRFGDRDHTTVMHARRKYASLVHGLDPGAAIDLDALARDLVAAARRMAELGGPPS